MDVIANNYNTEAIAFSVVGLTMAAILPFFFNHYSRGLQFLQMCYIFQLTNIYTVFSSYLSPAMIYFNRNILTFCTPGDFVCSSSFELSFGVILCGILLVSFIIVQFIRRCGKQIEYQPVFRALKGFIKWAYLPLVGDSCYALLVAVNTPPISVQTILPPAIVLAFMALFPFVQLIVSKCVQKEDTNTWIKWLQFFSYLRLLITTILVSFQLVYLYVIYLNFIMIMLIIYPIFYVWKGDFKYPVLERIIYIIGEAAFLTLYYIFTYDNSNNYTGTYNLDFFLLGGILLLDLMLYAVKIIRLVLDKRKQGVTNSNNGLQLQGNAESASKIEFSSRGAINVSKIEHNSIEQLNNQRDFIDEIGKKGPSPKKKK